MCVIDMCVIRTYNDDCYIMTLDLYSRYTTRVLRKISLRDKKEDA